MVMETDMGVMRTFFFLFLDCAVAESAEVMNSLAKLCVTFWTEGVGSCDVQCTVFCLWMRGLRNMSRCSKKSGVVDVFR